MENSICGTVKIVACDKKQYATISQNGLYWLEQVSSLPKTASSLFMFHDSHISCTIRSKSGGKENHGPTLNILGNNMYGDDSPKNI